MDSNRLSENQINRLADDVHAKIIASRALIANSKGKLTVEIYPKGEGSEINIIVTT